MPGLDLNDQNMSTAHAFYGSRADLLSRRSINKATELQGEYHVSNQAAISALYYLIFLISYCCSCAITLHWILPVCL